MYEMSKPKIMMNKKKKSETDGKARTPAFFSFIRTVSVQFMFAKFTSPNEANKVTRK